MASAEKDKWVEAVMQSLDGIKPADPAEHIYKGIIKRISEKVSYEKIISMPTLSFAAAAVFLLLILNLAVFSVREKGNHNHQNIQELVNDYQLNDNIPGL